MRTGFALPATVRVSPPETYDRANEAAFRSQIDAALTAIVASAETLWASRTPTRGGMYIAEADALPTVIVTQAVWTALAGTWTTNPAIELNQWSTPSNGVLRFDGSTAQVVLISGKISITPGAGNTEYSLTYALNGTASEEFAASHRFAGPQSGNAKTTIPITALIEIAQDDEITLMVRNDTGTEDCTAARATLNVIGFIK